MNASETANVQIRRATVSDAEALGRMRASSAFERHPGDARNRTEYERLCAGFFANQLSDERSFLRSWIALRDGAIAGSASLTIFPTLPRYGHPFGGVDGRVRDVYVEPRFRRSGVARALMQAVLSEARTLAVDRLTLGSS
jgi:GNAT superfamily N-acetyltransferase